MFRQTCILHLLSYKKTPQYYSFLFSNINNCGILSKVPPKAIKLARQRLISLMYCKKGFIFTFKHSLHCLVNHSINNQTKKSFWSHQSCQIGFCSVLWTIMLKNIYSKSQNIAISSNTMMKLFPTLSLEPLNQLSF